MEGSGTAVPLSVIAVDPVKNSTPTPSPVAAISGTRVWSIENANVKKSVSLNTISSIVTPALRSFVEMPETSLTSVRLEPFQSSYASPVPPSKMETFIAGQHQREWILMKDAA